MRDELPGRCEHCVQPDCPIVQGFGVGGGITVVGEAPGANEVQRGQPFVGESGRLIRAVFEGLGVSPDDIYWTNAVICRPPANKTPTQTLIRACHARLRFELDLIQPAKVLTLGGVALTSVMGAAKVLPITKMRGRGMMVNGIYTLGTYHPAAVLRDPDLFRDLANDIEKFLVNDQPLPEDNLEVVVPTSVDETVDYLKSFRDASAISCDLETTGFNPITNSILSVGFGALVDSVAAPRTSPAGVSIVAPVSLASAPPVSAAIKAILTSENAPIIVFHNAKFDLQFLHRFYGQMVRPYRMADTMILHYGMDERPIGRYRAHGLKDLARFYYDADDYAWDFDLFFKTPEEERDYAALYYYQGQDCYYTIRLWEDLFAEAYAESPGIISLMTDLLWPATQAFSEIELAGLQVDLDYFKAFQKRTEDHIKDVGQQLDEVVRATTGITDFNPMSPLQAQDIIYNKWKLPKGKDAGFDRGGSGVRWYGGRETSDESTGKVQLQFLTKKTDDPVIKKALLDIIEYRTSEKVLKTYITGLMALVDPDQRLRSDFRLAGTATGRLSSSDPNLQNIPAQRLGPEIRNGFIPRDGYVFLEADYSQLELRVAAWYSDDTAMKETFKNGLDIHRIVAAKMFRKPEGEITTFQRYMAKFVDFGILYGRGAKSLTEGQEVEWLEEQGVPRWTLSEAEFFLNEFLGGFPGLATWMKEQKARALRDKQVTTKMGRIRRFPLIPASDRGSVERQAVNTPIQSLASDVCLRSLVKLHNELPEGAYVLFPVHDSILFEIREDLVEELAPFIKRTMEGGFPFPSDVPFPVDMKVGTRWGSLESYPKKEEPVA